MFNRPLVAMIFAGLLLSAGCNDNAQLPGGYSAVGTQSLDVIASAEFAVAEQLKANPGLVLKSIESAKTQVVAGMNVDMVLNVVDGAKAKSARAIVYTDLNQTRTLTSWVWL